MRKKKHRIRVTKLVEVDHSIEYGYIRVYDYEA